MSERVPVSRRPRPTLVYRLVHVDNLPTLAARGGIHAPSRCPTDGRSYRPIHDPAIQRQRGPASVPCGPGGRIVDYVSFYLSPRSPMLYRISKGTLPYAGGQGPIVYLVSSIERLDELRLSYVFSDGHSLAALTRWFDDPAKLDDLDWEILRADYWADTEDDPDRSRRRQAELLVHELLPWKALIGIAAIDERMVHEVRERLAHSQVPPPTLKAKPDWYYLGPMAAP